MSSRYLNFILASARGRSRWNCRLCSTISQTTDQRDPAPFFFDHHVQELLTTLTRIDYRKVFAARKDGTPLEVPKFLFMTDEQLRETRAKIQEKARGRIQMPPVVKMRSDRVQVLSEDPELQGFDENDFIFTDISFGVGNRDRLIVVRESSGRLRHANPSERHRMNQIYFPIDGREVHVPQMFFKPHLDELLEKGEFVFILDRACLQFDPDDPEYHRVTGSVYSYVNETRKFETLRSTRHFGPLAFRLAWDRCIDNLLVDVIRSGNTEEAAALIRLYHRLHPEAASAAEPTLHDLDLIGLYAELDSPRKHEVEQALDEHRILTAERKRIEEGVTKAHGLTEGRDA